MGFFCAHCMLGSIRDHIADVLLVTLFKAVRMQQDGSLETVLSKCTFFAAQRCWRSTLAQGFCAMM